MHLIKNLHFSRYRHITLLTLLSTATHIFVITKGATVLLGFLSIENIYCPIWFIDCIPNITLCYTNHYQSLCTFTQIDWIAKNCVFGFYIILMLRLKIKAVTSVAIAVDLLGNLVKTYLLIYVPDHLLAYISELMPVLTFIMPFLLAHWDPYSLRLSNDCQTFPSSLQWIKLFLNTQS